MARYSGVIVKGALYSRHARPRRQGDTYKYTDLESKHGDEPRRHEITAAAAAATNASASPEDHAPVDLPCRSNEEASLESVRMAIMGKSALSAPGMDDLGMIDLQSILAKPVGNDSLSKMHIDMWATACRQQEIIPPEWWYLYTMAMLSAVGRKQRPIAVGSAVRRKYVSVWCREHRPLLQGLFHEVGQFDGAVSGGR